VERCERRKGLEGGEGEGEEDRCGMMEVPDNMRGVKIE
jgi:hypothetical protein